MPVTMHSHLAFLLNAAEKRGELQIKKVMGLDIPIPHYSTLSDRSEGLEIIRLAEQIEPGSHVIADASGLKVYGAGQWQETKHGLQKRRIWRKLHIAVPRNIKCSRQP